LYELSEIINPLRKRKLKFGNFAKRGKKGIKREKKICPLKNQNFGKPNSKKKTLWKRIIITLILVNNQNKNKGPIIKKKFFKF